jgi:hypothetical protein
LMQAVMTSNGPPTPGLPNTGSGGANRNLSPGSLILPAALLALFGAGVYFGRRRNA